MLDVGIQKMTAQEYLASYPISSQAMELINGEVMTMPSPFNRHSQIVSNIMWILQSQTRPLRLGMVQTEPADIHFDDYNVLQPDVFFIHKDNSRCQVAEDGYLHGAPDLCVEVLSKSTAKVDKFGIYEKYAVREYWLVDPETELVEVYQHTGEHFMRAGAYDTNGQFVCLVLPDLSIAVAEIFAAS